MRPRPGAARVAPMANVARTDPYEVTLWTEFVIAGQRVFIRTRRPQPLSPEPRESAVEKGGEPPEIEVRPAAAGAEP
jgi:hypothetical protein